MTPFGCGPTSIATETHVSSSLERIFAFKYTNKVHRYYIHHHLQKPCLDTVSNEYAALMGISSTKTLTGTLVIFVLNVHTTTHNVKTHMHTNTNGTYTEVSLRRLKHVWCFKWRRLLLPVSICRCAGSSSHRLCNGWESDPYLKWCCEGHRAGLWPPQIPSAPAKRWVPERAGPRTGCCL